MNVFAYDKYNKRMVILDYDTMTFSVPKQDMRFKIVKYD